MNNIIIRDYQPDDYPAIEQLWEITGLGGAIRGDDQETIERSIGLGGKLLVAENEEKILLATSWMTYDGRRLHLHHFGVLPSYQRKGIGKLIAERSLEFARNHGTQIKLEVHKSNIAAIELYKQMGFQYLGDYLVYIIR